MSEEPAGEDIFGQICTFWFGAKQERHDILQIKLKFSSHLLHSLSRLRSVKTIQRVEVDIKQLPDMARRPSSAFSLVHSAVAPPQSGNHIS